jgi:hypothetical protein
MIIEPCGRQKEGGEVKKEFLKKDSFSSIAGILSFHYAHISLIPVLISTFPDTGGFR